VVGVSPCRVEIAFFANLFVGVPAKEVTLGLGQVGRQPGAAVRVKVAQRCAQSRDGHTTRHSQGHKAASRLLASIQLRGEAGVHHEVRQVRVVGESSLNATQECRPNDSTAFPNARAFGSVDVPVVRFGSGTYQIHTLRV